MSEALALEVSELGVVDRWQFWHNPVFGTLDQESQVRCLGVVLVAISTCKRAVDEVLVPQRFGRADVRIRVTAPANAKVMLEGEGWGGQTRDASSNVLAAMARRRHRTAANAGGEDISMLTGSHINAGRGFGVARLERSTGLAIEDTGVTGVVALRRRYAVRAIESRVARTCVAVAPVVCIAP